MKYIVVFTFFFWLLFVVSGTSGQTRQIENGDLASSLHNYGEAIMLYLEALDKSPYDYQLFKKLGDCYLLSKNRTEALRFYEKCMITGKFHKDDSIQYARLLLYSGKPEKAGATFAELLQRYPDDQELKRMGDCCKFAVNQLSQSNLPQVENDELLNSQQNDYGIAFFGDSLIFVSTRLNRDFLSIDKLNETGNSDFYMTFFDTKSQKYTKPSHINNNLNTISGKDAFTFSPLTGKAFFSGYNNDSSKSRIFEAKLKGKRWIDIKPVNMGFNDYNFMHPALSADGKSLFFISDRPGGYGGKDIWKTSLSVAGTWTESVNLGSAVNTDKDEVYPYVSGDSLLFFSSEGHTGMGGLDIFATRINDDQLENPVNIGAPFNSTSDDFGIILGNPGSGGYFCSDRVQDRQIDIFAFNIPAIPTNVEIPVETRELTVESIKPAVEVATVEDTVRIPVAETDNRNEVRKFIPLTINDSVTSDSVAKAFDTAVVHYRIQVMASTQLVDQMKQFSSIADIIAGYGMNVEKIKNVFKYRIGNFTTEKEALALQQILRKRGYRDCFPVIIK